MPVVRSLFVGIAYHKIFERMRHLIEGGAYAKAELIRRFTVRKERTRLPLYPHSFLVFSVSFNQSLVSLAGYAQKHGSTYWTLCTSARLRFEESIYICLTVIATLS